ncbi:MAG: efflux RND transporter periplasmic adaptor subunit, partial [Gammaproteobacteria bacterium]|nr:efflux RND transporter periplasmic adaptor subunit [Gammaproteobacteria bacterium]
MGFSDVLRSGVYLLMSALLLALSGCGDDEAEAQAPEVRRTLVVVSVVEPMILPVEDTAVGYIESEAAPVISAEVAGRVVRVAADVGAPVEVGMVLARIDDKDYRDTAQEASAEVKQVEALLQKQRSLVKRYRDLGAASFVSTNTLEDAEADLTAYQEQLEGARARLSIAEANLAKTEIVSPVAGAIQQRYVTPGSFVKVGDALFDLSTRARLRVHLPFPENAVARLRAGLPVRMSSPVAPGVEVQGVVEEIRPRVSQSTRSIEAIVRVDAAEAPGWQPGASVTGTVTIESRNALLVPEIAVVRRPSGEVIYLIEEDVARERKVVTGLYYQGLIEIR